MTWFTRAKHSLGVLRLTPSLILLTLGVLLVFIGISNLLVPQWPPRVICTEHDCKEAREWIASSVTLLVLLGGLYQYRRSQLWKRAEFVADEMKVFFDDSNVKKALLMIDWSTRRINLLDSNSPEPKDWPLVDRCIQGRALWPHKLKRGSESATEPDSEQAADSDLAGYTQKEVAIRDGYDAFLDGLERFSGFVKTGLVTPADLRPYLGYWLDDIAAESDDDADNEWSFWFLSYMHFYKFTGTRDLFLAFHHNVDIASPLFDFFRGKVKDQTVVALLMPLLTKTSATQ